MAPFVTLTIYAIVALTTSQQGILASQAFASLALISLITDPMVRFCQALPSLAQSAACFGRIQTYLLTERTTSPDAVEPVHHASDMPLERLDTKSIGSPDDLFTFDKSHIAWSREAQPVLHNISLTISGGFTAIIGAVGSGKSTLLSSMLGETTLLRGSCSAGLSPIAYCPQTPWILNDTIRRNIVGTTEHKVNEEWMGTCLHLTKLQKDIQGFERGVETPVGPDGLFLSGGQRQRLVRLSSLGIGLAYELDTPYKLRYELTQMAFSQSLARAIYSRQRIIVLDDVFSGLDPTTAMEVSSMLFGARSYFRNSGITVVMATHNSKEFIAS